MSYGSVAVAPSTTLDAVTRPATPSRIATGARAPWLPRPSLAERIDFLLALAVNQVIKLACLSFDTFLALFERLSPAVLERGGRVRARAAFFRALTNVPGYAEFVASSRAPAGRVPETDKESYILRFRTEERCVGGRLPRHGVSIDESSGSTGTPFDWVRTATERHQSHIFISFFATYVYGKEPWITINAFSMGAWATGVNMGVSMERNGLVKNTGPDVGKILHTLRFFGPQYRYVIAGYPPFLKHLLDAADAEGFPWHDFRVSGLAGGEGMSEGLRDYLERRFERVFSGYGATDLEIGIAGETPLTVAIRRLARDRADLREALFGADSRLPMLFQYNPLMHHIEVNDDRELVFTITRSSLLSPRIRYNIHDEGGVARFDVLAGRLAAAGVDVDALRRKCGAGRLRLPFLWVYGRRDYTVSVMGANIYPEDVEQCLYAESRLAQVTRSFCLGLAEGADGSVRPRFAFEVSAPPTDALRAEFAERITPRLIALNADFREAWREYPETLVPVIELHGEGEGPFSTDAGRIKQVRLLKKS
ncbi:MAG: phenylacetate--CoA ligase family protein [Gemmatimonadales bacterium]